MSTPGRPVAVARRRRRWRRAAAAGRGPGDDDLAGCANPAVPVLAAAEVGSGRRRTRRRRPRHPDCCQRSRCRPRPRRWHPRRPRQRPRRRLRPGTSGLRAASAPRSRALTGLQTTRRRRRALRRNCPLPQRRRGSPGWTSRCPRLRPPPGTTAICDSPPRPPWAVTALPFTVVRAAGGACRPSSWAAGRLPRLPRRRRWRQCRTRTGTRSVAYSPPPPPQPAYAAVSPDVSSCTMAAWPPPPPAPQHWTWMAVTPDGTGQRKVPAVAQVWDGT